MSVHLVNPSDNSLERRLSHPVGCLFLPQRPLRAAGDPILVDESLEPIVPETIMPGDIVGISVHTGNALRGYEVGKMARARGAWVVYGGIHATLFPEEAFEHGRRPRGRQRRRRRRLGHGCRRLHCRQTATAFTKAAGSKAAVPGRALGPDAAGKYMWASVQTIRGCPKHCSFCSVGGPTARSPGSASFRVSSMRSSPCAGSDSGSSPLPTITSTRSRSPIFAWPGSRITSPRWRS